MPSYSRYRRGGEYERTKTSIWRWNCSDGDCYLDTVCLKFDVFDDCFPNNIRMSDLDGFVEINSFFLIMEWKSGVQLPTGPRIAFQRFTRRIKGDIVFAVQGNAQTMEVNEFYVFFKSYSSLIKIKGDLEELRDLIKAWVQCALSNNWNHLETKLTKSRITSI